MSAPNSLDRSDGLFEEISAEAWARGAGLALEMFEEGDIDEMGLEDGGRDGRPQDNLVYRYLQRLRREAAADQQVEVAFCAVLTEAIANQSDGMCHSIDSLEALVRDMGAPRQALQP
jgi:hypothetical protein